MSRYSTRFSLTPAWLIETRFLSLGVTRLRLGPGLGGWLWVRRAGTRVLDPSCSSAEYVVE